MDGQLMEALAERMKTTPIPETITMNRHGSGGLPYYIEVVNDRTGQTKLLPRAKAFRYINNRPSMWHIGNPLVSFKDTYSIKAKG